jgi:hypothetical protein
MTLKHRLMLVTAVAVAATFLLGLVCYRQGQTLGASIEELSSKSVTGAFSIGKLNGLAKDLRGKMRSHVVETAPAAMAKLDQEITELAGKLDKELSRLGNDLSTPAQQQRYAAIRPRVVGFTGAWSGMHQASRDNHPDAMKMFLDRVMPRFKELQDSLDGLEEQLQRDVVATSEQARVSARQTTIWSLILVGGGVVMVLWIGWWISNYMTNFLNRSVDRLRESASLIQNMAQELHQANEQISSGATQQVAALHETSTIGMRVKDLSTTFSSQASVVVDNVVGLKKGMDETRSTMNRLVGQMKAIEESSAKIQRLSGLVEAIAFQTHILSLNASIEAARSGEAGRGFEVVAGEVKSLAQQSSEAAQETANLIAESLDAVSAGSGSLQQIVATVEKVNRTSDEIRGLVSTIEAASREQATNMIEISRALHEVENVSSRNAANAEQGFAQQRDMEQQASILLGVVGELEAIVRQP